MNLGIVILLILISLALVCLAIIAIDNHRLVVRRYEISSSKLNRDKKYVFLTDLHSRSFGKNNEKLIKMIDETSPDAILISGDMYTAIEGDDTSVCFNLLKKLSLKYKIFFANGNHERKTKERKDEFPNMYDDLKKVLEECKIIHLENKQYENDDTIISGLDLDFKYYKKFLNINPSYDELNGALGECNKDKFNIMLAHNPEYFADYALWGADLVLSGHYHGGLVRLPLIGGVISPRYRLFPKYDFGEYEMNDSKMYLSCGLGAHTLPIRMFNPGEITLIEIKKRNN